MSWHCSRALVAEYSAANCSDGELSAQLSTTPTPDQFYWPDKTTEHSRLSRFGMTCVPLTAGLGEAVLTWFLEAFPARTSALPAEVMGLTVSVPDSGLKWRGSLARYDQDSRSWRTHQLSLTGELAEFSGTWTRWGMTRNGEWFPLPTPELRTFESEFGFWQTPVADDAVNRTAGKWNSRGEPKLSAEVKLWPTPTVCGNYNRPGASATSGMGLASAVKLWPTPCAQPANGTPARFMQRKQEWIAKGSAMGLTLSDLQLAAVASERGMEGRGQLNPPWVEWLMGWPIEWTELKPLETGKFREWQQQHGESSEAPE